MLERQHGFAWEANIANNVVCVCVINVLIWLNQIAIRNVSEAMMENIHMSSDDGTMPFDISKHNRSFLINASNCGLQLRLSNCFPQTNTICPMGFVGPTMKGECVSVCVCVYVFIRTNRDRYTCGLSTLYFVSQWHPQTMLRFQLGMIN